MTKSQKIGFVLILTALLLGCALSRPTIAAYSTETYTVQPGDTLWGIARDNKPPHLDARTYVELLKRINGVDCRLSPGQAINVPRWEE